MKTTRFMLVAALTASTLFFSACDSNDTDGGGNATVNLKLQPVYDGQNLIMDQVYMHNGTAIKFTGARMYVSDFTLIANDGTESTFEMDPLTVPAKDMDGNDVTHTVTDRIILARHDLGEDTYLLGTAPAGSYTGVHFKMGIDGMDNRIDPSQAPAGSPLAKQTDKNNHWNWSNGYIYLRIDGEVDTDGDNIPDTPIETHIGSTNFLSSVSLSSDFDLTADVTSDIHIMVDYDALLQDVDFADPAQRLCHTADNLPVATKVSQTAADAFMLHGVHEM